MSLLVPERRPQEELLDQKNLPLREIERSLADIRWVNRFWGGHRAAETTVLRAIVALGGPQTLLDLGSGSGDVPTVLAERAARRGVALSVSSLDSQLAHLTTARSLLGRSAPALIAGDARQTPFSDGSFDWVMSSLFFHHFSPEENVLILREMCRLARRGLFVLDLRRHRLARLAAIALGPLFFCSDLTIADARMSVEQAYTTAEVRAIARQAGLEGAEIRRASPFRLVLSSRSQPMARNRTPGGRNAGGKVYDVAVIGAGPAGSAAAIELARRGFSCVVLERDRFPRHKVCGEFLSHEAVADLARWGLDARIREKGVERIDTGAFYFEDRRAIEFPLPRPAIGASRFLLDAMLAECAGAAGAELRFGEKVEDVSGDLERGFTIAVGAGEKVEARSVLAAWGRWSALDLAMGRGFATRRRGRFFGWSRHDDGDSSHLAGRVHLYFFRGGYCGLSRVEHGIVNFAGVVAEDELRRRGAGWERFLSALLEEQSVLRRHLAPLAPSRAVLGTSAVFFERHAPTFGGILGAGDAAGIRDPFTGDGQATAIRSGVLAASLLESFLRRSIDAADFERAYRAAWRREFGARFTWDALCRRALFSRTARRALLPVALPLVRAGIERTRLKRAAQR